MTTPAPEVDTSIAGEAGVLSDLVMPAVAGVSSPAMPDLSGDMLPVSGFTEFSNAFMNSSSPTSFQFTQNATGKRSDVLNFAKQFLGVPYVWGGTSPKGFDCSGFTQYVLRRFGVNLPRVSQAQANAGTRTAISDLQPGDLVLFNEGNSQQGPGHVAIYMGGGQIIEAPHTGASVRIRSLGKGESVFGVHLNIPSK